MKQQTAEVCETFIDDYQNIRTLRAPIATYAGDREQEYVALVSFRLTAADAVRLGEYLIELKDVPADTTVQIMADEYVVGILNP